VANNTNKTTSSTTKNTENSDTANLTKLQKKRLRIADKDSKKVSKSKVSLSRRAKRFNEKSEKEAKGNPHAKIKLLGSSPSASRKTPAKGVFQKVAAKTKFFHGDDAQRNWILIDARDKTVGRLASEIAKLLKGKHKAQFTPNIDNGDFVVVTNVEKVKFSSDNKEINKFYYRHTGWMGGMIKTSAVKMRETKPENILGFAVKGMLPKTKLGRAQLKKLKLYVGDAHPHSAQNPIKWEPKI